MMAEHLHLGRVKPVKMWAIARMSIRSPWILPGTVRKTRTEAIDAFIFEGMWQVWDDAYKRGFRTVEVTVNQGW